MLENIRLNKYYYTLFQDLVEERAFWFVQIMMGIQLWSSQHSEVSFTLEVKMGG